MILPTFDEALEHALEEYRVAARQFAARRMVSMCTEVDLQDREGFRLSVLFGDLPLTPQVRAEIEPWVANGWILGPPTGMNNCDHRWLERWFLFQRPS